MKGRKHGNVPKKRKLVIWILLMLGFCAIEFPGILLVRDRVYPFVLGMPFLYGYILCCWMYMCSVLFYAYRTSWGKTAFFRKTEKDKEKANNV